MSRRPRFLPPAAERPARRAAAPWVTRTIVIVAVLVVVAALVVTIATGTLFTTPSGR